MKSYAKAIDLAEGERLNTPDDPQLLIQLANFYASIGKKDLSLARLNSALASPRRDPSIDYRAAVVYMLLGQPKQAEPLVLRALALKSNVVEIEHSPELAPLRSEAAVQVLMGRRLVPPVIIPPVITPPTPPALPR